MKAIVLLCVLIFGASRAHAQTAMQKIIEEVRRQYAPDRRVAVFQVEANARGTLTGKTNIPEARAELTGWFDTTKTYFAKTCRHLFW